jgi:hypothetical protein
MPSRTSKRRTEVPKETAARVLFLSSRTCGVCRVSGKPVQIHHLDEDSVNHKDSNLSVLCLECHNETMQRGGFGRKLDAEQIVLYRDDWYRSVSRTRATDYAGTPEESEGLHDLTYATSIAEIYREQGDFEALARHYDSLGNHELRDKYIELALKGAADGETIIYLRNLQGRVDLVPQPVIEERLAKLREKRMRLRRARLNLKLGRAEASVSDYLDGISDRLKENRHFTAAFYLKELSESGLIDTLFERALADAEADEDLWWQVRALEELERFDEARDLVLANEHRILTSEDNLLFQELLALAKGDKEAWLEARKELARSGGP